MDSPSAMRQRMHSSPPPSPERFRSYLRVLAELHLGREGRGKVEPSDVVQETMLEAHRKRHQFRGSTEAQMAAWLRAMLACNLADAVKAQRRGKRDVDRERSLEAAVHQSSARLEAWLVSAQASPSERCERHEAVLELLDALTALPPAQRRALVMRHCQGCSLVQIAEELDRTPTAVAGLLKRGLATLRTILQPSQGDRR
ncbi:MAG: sigma-70 family RNA polymerase sigma factor [Isosphaeraceae bacterium]